MYTSRHKKLCNNSMIHDIFDTRIFFHLTPKVPITTAADDTFVFLFFLLLSFEEKKACHFM